MKCGPVSELHERVIVLQRTRSIFVTVKAGNAAGTLE